MTKYILILSFALMFAIAAYSQTASPSATQAVAAVPTLSPIPIPIIAEAPVPVTFSLPFTVTILWISSIAIGLGGLIAIGKFVMKASAIIGIIPVMIEIAHEFKNNQGSTLRDTTDRIEQAIIELRKLIELKTITTK